MEEHWKQIKDLEGYFVDDEEGDVMGDVRS